MDNILIVVMFVAFSVQVSLTGLVLSTEIQEIRDLILKNKKKDEVTNSNSNTSIDTRGSSCNK